MKKLFFCVLIFSHLICYSQTKIEFTQDSIKHTKTGKYAKSYFTGGYYNFTTNQSFFNFSKLIKINNDSVPIWPDIRTYITSHPSAVNLNNGILKSSNSTLNPWVYNVSPLTFPGSVGSKFVVSFPENVVPDSMRKNRLLYGGEFITTNLSYNTLKLYYSNKGLINSSIKVDTLPGIGHQITITPNSSSQIGILKLNGYLRTYQYQGSVTDGIPTEAQINSIIGTASSKGLGFKATIKDTDGSGLLYIVESDGTYWYYAVMTKSL